MKQLFAVGFICFSIMAANAQKLNEADVPVIIKDAFAKMYPDIKKALWNMEGKLYRARFAESNYKGTVLFANDGKWTERETAIPAKYLPVSIKTYMGTNYKNRKITEASKITRASGEMLHKVAIGSKQMLFTKDGDFIKVGK